MAKPRNPPFSQDELRAFISERSDFAFEMLALNQLSGVGFACRHAATFVDPISGKIREFDIRARRAAEGIDIRLAVECKHLTLESPLIAHRTPRGPHESNHSLITYHCGRDVSTWRPSTVSPSRMYPTSEHVGRKLEQPKKKDDGTPVHSDSATFEKWSQALSGVHDELARLVAAPPSQTITYGVIPVLVVPDGTLFAVDYDMAGAIVSELRPVLKAELFVGHTWVVSGWRREVSVAFSHIEIVTLSRMGQWARGLLEEGCLFPSE